jgi:Tol biopolymer transport system component
MPSTSRLLPLPVVVLVSVLAACGGGSDLVEPTTGTIHISTATTGDEPDADGYTVQVDGGTAQAIAAAGEISVTADSGSHTVRLDGVAANCALAGDNPRTISVADDETTEVAFAITCTATTVPTGSAQVTTATSGTLPDPDGYSLSVDGGAAQPIAANGSAAFDGLTPGSHTAALSGIASNCQVTPAAEQAFDVTAGAAASVAYTITCGATQVAFSSNAPGLQAVFVVNPDGSDLHSLTPDGVFMSTPIWSPDARQILFAMEDGLHVMNADGRNAHRLARNEVGIIQYRWSPDGAHIAYVALRESGGDVIGDLWVMNADGSGKLMLAGNAEQPTWAPDSRRIGYTSVGDILDMHIRSVAPDGTGDGRVTPTGTQAFEPDWSPDGGRIAFVTFGENDIVLINPDGTGLLNLTNGVAVDDSPTWSPDGSRIAFNTGAETEPLESDVAVMSRDGSGRTNLSNLAGFDFGPSWSPDGSGLVFASTVDGNSEVYVMNADGTGQKNLSQHPDAEDTEADWSGRTADGVQGSGVRIAKRRWQLELCKASARCGR